MQVQRGSVRLMAIAGALMLLLAFGCTSGEESTLNEGEQTASGESATQPTERPALSAGEFEITAFDSDSRASGQLTEGLDAEVRDRRGGAELVIRNENENLDKVFLKVRHPEDLRARGSEFARELRESENVIGIDFPTGSDELGLVAAQKRSAAEGGESADFSGELVRIEFVDDEDGPRRVSAGQDEIVPEMTLNPVQPDSPQKGVSKSDGFVRAELRLRGDANGDGAVDFSDINSIINNFGSRLDEPAVKASLNTELEAEDTGRVDFSDVLAVIRNFGIRVGEVSEYRANSAPIDSSSTQNREPHTTHPVSQVLDGRTEDGWASLKIPFNSEELPEEDIFAAYKADISGLDSSSELTGTVNLGWKPREISGDTFSIRIQTRDGHTVNHTMDRGVPEYEIEPGQCYFLVFATGPLSESLPAGWGSSDPEVQSNIDYQGEYRIADAGIGVAFPAGTMRPVNQSGTRTDDDTLNPGEPDFSLSDDCETREKVSAGGQEVTVPNPVYQSESDDGVFDLGEREAFGADAKFSANWTGVPLQMETQFGVSELVRGKIDPSTHLVQRTESVDLVGAEFGQSASWFQFAGQLPNTSLEEQVRPEETVPLLSVGVKANENLSSGTEIPLALLDASYAGGQRYTEQGETDDSGLYRTWFKNLAGERIIPKLQDIRLEVK